VGPSRTVVYMCLTPLIAVIAAAVLLGERPRPLQAVGAVMILGGVVLTRKPDEERGGFRSVAPEG
jgi:drug/metabolite transporter (DMT)-like permease